MANFDFNTAGAQRVYDLIPVGTTCELQMTIRPGGVSDDPWLTQAADGGSVGLDCEFTVVSPEPYGKRKLWQRFTMKGTTPGHQAAGEISRSTLRAILESARGVHPDDHSEEANARRKIVGWEEFQNLRFVAQLGVVPAKGDYPAKNTIKEIITPERKAWKQPEQIAAAGAQTTLPLNQGGQSAPPPANAIVRPQWAGGANG